MALKFQTSNKSIVLLAIFALLVQYSHQYEQKNIIKEEDNVMLDQLAPGKNNLLNKLTSQTQQKTVAAAESSSNNKINSNKEFVFGEDDDDDEDKLNIEVPSSDLNMLNSNPSFETEMSNKDSIEDQIESDEMTSSEEDEKEVLKRNQRVDVKHPSHDKHLPSLLKFNKMSDLQQKLLELSDSKHNFDYDILIDDDFFEKNKKKLSKVNNNKKANIALDSFENEINDEIAEDDVDEEEPRTITVEDLMSQLETKMKGNEFKAKFSKPTLQLKEQLYLEGIFNNKPNKNDQSKFKCCAVSLILRCCTNTT